MNSKLKKTEVGNIPEDWEVYKLKDILTWKGGGTPSKSISEYWNGSICWISPKDVKSKVIIDTEDKISEISIEKSATNLFPAQSVLVVVRSGILKHKMPFAILGVPSAINQDIKIFISKTILSNRYLYYLLTGNEQRLRQETVKTGTTVESVDLFAFGKSAIPLPPTLAEQEAIATVLSDTDAWIESLEGQIEKKKLIKQGTMQELLTGKRRLPGFGEGKGRKDSEVGRIPEDWEVKPIKKIIITDSGIKIGPFGSQLRKEFLTNKGFKVYGQENIFKRNFSLGSRYISKEHFYKLQSSELKPGDIIISMMGTIGEVMIVPQKFEAGIMDSHLIRLRLIQNQIYPLYFIFYFSSELLYQQIKRQSVGGIMEGLSSKIIKGLPILIPENINEQEAMAKVLSEIDEEIEVLEQKVEKAKGIKQGLMQVLLTGKIRLV